MGGRLRVSDKSSVPGTEDRARGPFRICRVPPYRWISHPRRYKHVEDVRSWARLPHDAVSALNRAIRLVPGMADDACGRCGVRWQRARPAGYPAKAAFVTKRAQPGRIAHVVQDGRVGRPPGLDVPPTVRSDVGDHLQVLVQKQVRRRVRFHPWPAAALHVALRVCEGGKRALPQRPMYQHVPVVLRDDHVVGLHLRCDRANVHGNRIQYVGAGAQHEIVAARAFEHQIYARAPLPPRPGGLGARAWWLGLRQVEASSDRREKF
eukprot:3396795-Prymnesium_polylepis.1